MQLQELNMFPVAHPAFPYDEEQSMTCCTEYSCCCLQKITDMPSIPPIAEKAQLAVHEPWFFTGETAPQLTQSTFRPTIGAAALDSGVVGWASKWERYMASNSCLVQAVNWFTPCLQEWAGLELCSSMAFTFFWKMRRRYSRSWGERSSMSPWVFLHSSNTSDEVFSFPPWLRRRSEASARVRVSTMTFCMQIS